MHRAIFAFPSLPLTTTIFPFACRLQFTPNLSHAVQLWCLCNAVDFNVIHAVMAGVLHTTKPLTPPFQFFLFNFITSLSFSFSSISNFRLTPIFIVSFISTTTPVDTEYITFLFGRLSYVYIRSWTLVDKMYQLLWGMVTDTMADTSSGSAATT